MERLTKYITPVGKCMTTLNSMKHYMPCVPCRHKAEIKTDSKGNMYTEKFSFCDTCEVKMLFNKLKEYEDAEEQGLLLRLPCKIGRKVFYVQKCLAPSCKECKGFLRVDNCYCQYKARIFEQEFDYRHLKAFGKSVFLTKEEAEQALVEMEKGNSK